MAVNKSKDHLILPKKTLMQFLDEKQLISVIEFTSGECIKEHIVPHHPRTFHAKLGYYDSDVDKAIKKMETSIGEWRKRITDYIESIKSEEDTANLNFDEMRNFAINLISLQFNRNVMVDSGLRSKFINSEISKLKEAIPYHRIYGNIATVKKLESRLDQLQQFAVDSSDFPIFFQKNYMVNGNRLVKNTLIKEQYKDFTATILVIPAETNVSFLLTPQHYFAVDTVARIILGPRMAIGLYPKEMKIPDNRIIEVSEEQAFSFVARSIESALEMTEDAFKQLIGEKSFLQKVESTIKTCNSMINNNSENGICTIKASSEINENVFSVLIILLYKCGVKKALLCITKGMYNTLTTFNWETMLNNCGIKMAIVSSDVICGSFVPCYKTDTEAVEYLNG